MNAFASSDPIVRLFSFVHSVSYILCAGASSKKKRAHVSSLSLLLLLTPAHRACCSMGLSLVKPLLLFHKVLTNKQLLVSKQIVVWLHLIHYPQPKYISNVHHLDIHKLEQDSTVIELTRRLVMVTLRKREGTSRC